MNVAVRSFPAYRAEPAIETRAGPTHPLRDLDALGEERRYRPGEEICIEGRNCEYWFRLVSGAALRWTPLADGRRRVLDLVMPSDYFGFFVPDDRGFVVEAAHYGATVTLYPRWCVDFLAEVEPETAAALRAIAREAASRMRQRLLDTRWAGASARGDFHAPDASGDSRRAAFPGSSLAAMRQGSERPPIGVLE